MLNRILHVFNSSWGGESAAAVSPRVAQVGAPVVTPKVNPGAQGVGVGVTLSSSSDAQQRPEDLRIATTDIVDSAQRNAATPDVIRAFSKVTPDMSAAETAFVRTGISAKYKAIARNIDGSANVEATVALQTVLTRLDKLPDYGTGFSMPRDIVSLGETLVQELRRNGSCAIELVLNKQRQPSFIQVIPTNPRVFEFRARKGTRDVFPVQRPVSGDPIPLDFPNVFYTSDTQDPLDVHSTSPVLAAVQTVVQDATFFRDLVRTIYKALQPRLQAIIDSVKFTQSLDISTKSDPAKLKTAQEGFVSSVASTLNGLRPESVLVGFDNVTYKYLDRGATSLGTEWETVHKILSARNASGTKVPPSVLGHSAGSQNIASTEALLFLKQAAGTQGHVNSIISRALTLAVRLYGYDVAVEFEFKAPELRPESELQGFKQMEQSRILDALSLGMLSDEEACITLYGRLPPPGAPKLSGTGFRSGGSNDAFGNPFSNTSQPTTSNSVKPTTPAGAPGSNK